MYESNGNQRKHFLNRTGYGAAGLLVLAVLVMMGYMFILPMMVASPT